MTLITLLNSLSTACRLQQLQLYQNTFTGKDFPQDLSFSVGISAYSSSRAIVWSVTDVGQEAWPHNSRYSSPQRWGWGQGYKFVGHFKFFRTNTNSSMSLWTLLCALWVKPGLYSPRWHEGLRCAQQNNGVIVEWVAMHVEMHEAPFRVAVCMVFFVTLRTASEAAQLRATLTKLARLHWHLMNRKKTWSEQKRAYPQTVPTKLEA